MHTIQKNWYRVVLFFFMVFVPLMSHEWEAVEDPYWVPFQIILQNHYDNLNINDLKEKDWQRDSTTVVFTQFYREVKPDEMVNVDSLFREWYQGKNIQELKEQYKNSISVIKYKPHNPDNVHLQRYIISDDSIRYEYSAMIGDKRYYGFVLEVKK